MMHPSPMLEAAIKYYETVQKDPILLTIICQEFECRANARAIARYIKERCISGQSFHF